MCPGRFPLPHWHFRRTRRGIGRTRAGQGRVTKMSHWFARIGYVSLLGFVSALQFSIAAANIFLALALLMWLGHVASLRRIEIPRSSIRSPPIHADVGISAFSDDPNASFVDSKQLVLS